MPGWPKAGYGVTQRGGLRFSRCALTGVVGFWLSTGIASNGRYEETASEAGVAVVAGFVRTAGWPPEKRWRWSLARRSAKGLGYPVRPTQEPRPKVSPGIPDAEDKKVARAFLLGPIP
ncbi:MAG: hypothetical protein RIT02_3345 [Planctomycetota bacterium]